MNINPPPSFYFACSLSQTSVRYLLVAASLTGSCFSPTTSNGSESQALGRRLGRETFRPPSTFSVFLVSCSKVRENSDKRSLEPGTASAGKEKRCGKLDEAYSIRVLWHQRQAYDRNRVQPAHWRAFGVKMRRAEPGMLSLVAWRCIGLFQRFLRGQANKLSTSVLPVVLLLFCE